MASQRKRGPVAFRHRLSTVLALSLLIVVRTYHLYTFTAIEHLHYFSSRGAGYLWFDMSVYGLRLVCKQSVSGNHGTTAYEYSAS